MKKLLIISNNVLSNTNNNGKTILSFIDGVNDLDVAQLYLSGEKPKISKYKYFQISDKDIIKGILQKRKRGKVVTPCSESNDSDDFAIRNTVGRNEFTLIAREILWFEKWKSGHLLNWLDNFKPEAILFVAGDSLFAYSICEFIQDRYKSKLSIYVTDDYIMPRINENALHRLRRKAIKNSLQHILYRSVCFFTISESMRRTYKRMFHKDSYIIMNMADDLFDDSYVKKESEIILSYTGSFYYKRAEVLGLIAKAVQKYNLEANEKKAKLMMYSNTKPSKEILDRINIDGASEYGGSLNKEQLKERLNTSDILVFVESFDPEQVEKVKYSLSTKVPEYMSVGKPILAVGPEEAGSIEYLRGVSFIISNTALLNECIITILNDYHLRIELSKNARKKYLLKHNKIEQQSMFIGALFE